MAIKLLTDATILFVSTEEMSNNALNAKKYLLFDLNNCAGKELMMSLVHFTKDFSIIIHIQLKLNNVLTSILTKWSLQNFTHSMITVLRWHVQEFIVIWWPVIELQRCKVFIKFEFWAVSEVAPWLMDIDDESIYDDCTGIMQAWP